jgi:pimeloyl-ACP methyl ester carboxylesterase
VSHSPDVANGPTLARVPDQPKRITANGVDFAYFEEGRGPLVLLVHGFPDTAHTWDHVRPALAEAGYRAVSPFTRGYAPTSVPSDGRYDSDTLGRDLVALVEALGESSAVIVGHDWGASATYSAAVIAPERVRLLVTLAIPHPASVMPTPVVAWKVRHFFALSRKNAAAMVRANDFAYVDELVHRWSPAWKVPPGETDAVKACFRDPAALDAALGYYRALRLRLPPAQRKRIGVPAVSFAGETDILEQAAFDRARSRFTSTYEVVRMPGGHFLHREHPERFTSELLAVLDRHVGSK